MTKPLSSVLAIAILLLFFIQLAGTLVESIYILDLLKTSLDEKALGLLFFFTPVLLLMLRRSPPSWLVGLILAILVIARGLTPYLNTGNRMIASGLGVGATLLLLPLILTARPRGEPGSRSGLEASAGLALAIGLSITLRTLNYTLDYSLTPGGGWLGWVLGLILGWLFLRLDWQWDSSDSAPGSPSTLNIIGIFLALTLAYFAFSAPAVIARWTGGSYTLIILLTSLLSLGWAALVLYRPGLLADISRRTLLAWNLLFALALVATIQAHRVPYPPTPASPAIVVGQPTMFQQIPLLLLLLLFPVIFVDMGVFAHPSQPAKNGLRAWVPGMLLGSLALILLAFMSIFTNVWGYVEPVSPWFRGKFWFPFGLLGAALTLLSLRPIPGKPESTPGLRNAPWWGWMNLFAVIFILTVVGILRTVRGPSQDNDPNSLLVMTYNIQQANDSSGEKSYDRQIALIQEVNPDILALQENDSTRIGLNNNDYTHYFAHRLGYFCYYGPSTVAGTYGTAILSRYPLRNPRTVFTFSDQDEIAMTEAEIDIAGRVFTIYNVHPDGSDTAMRVFAQTLLERSQAKANVIAPGDYNIRQDEEAYQMIATVYTNAWLSVYPSGIDDQGLDMSGNKRIDHIFFSPHLRASSATYRLPPASWTDHPVHWAEIVLSEE